MKEISASINDNFFSRLFEKMKVEKRTNKINPDEFNKYIKRQMLLSQVNKLLKG